MSIYLYGCGGIGLVALEVAQAAGFAVKAFLDDYYQSGEFHGVPVRRGIATRVDQIEPDAEGLIVCLGDNQLRKITDLAVATGDVSLVHPTALLSVTSTLGSGSMVFHGGIVQAYASIGRGCIINTAARIDHDCEIGDYCHIAPNVTLCGNVSVKEGANVGAGSVVLPNLTIGEWSVIGAGSVVIKDVPAYATVAGNPARAIR